MSDQATFCATLVDEWVRAGVRHAVVSPGSRSTPLALALAARPELALHVVLDERSAAFVAVGLGRVLATPTVLLCTSGTAAANHLPAVVEAGLSRVPLLVCTADRPPDLHDVGGPQTIPQVGLFGTAVVWAVDVDPPAWAEASWRSLGSRAVCEAGGGPVHLNLRLREPLVEDPGPVPVGRADGAPWHRVAAASAGAGDPDPVLGRARRPLVVAGAGARSTGVRGSPLLADPLSGLRTAADVIGAFDALLRHPGFADAHQPDVVVQLGRPPASKVLATWLAGLPATVIAEGPPWLDPGRRADHVVPVVQGAADLVDAGWTTSWQRAEAAAQRAVDEVLADHPEVTEPGLARDVVRHLPDGAGLVVASSMPVRDVEWYGVPRPGLRVYANRGANGIDGVTSTALGVALARPDRPTACLLGDLAFLHDGSGLAGIAARRASLALVVVDNHGGGIFSFLPQARQLPADRFQQLFATPQAVDIPALAAAHGIPAVEVGSAADLPRCLAEATTLGGVRLLLARTDRDSNVAVHDELHAAVAAAIDAL